MAKDDNVTMISVYCGVCNAEHGLFHAKDIPKSFICAACGCGQKVSPPKSIGYSFKRNYPEGFWS